MGARWGPRRATVGPHLRDALRHLLFVFLVLLQAQAGRGGATLNGEGNGPRGAACHGGGRLVAVLLGLTSHGVVLPACRNGVARAEGEGGG